MKGDEAKLVRSDKIITGYETMRKHMLDNTSAPTNLGLAVFLRRGMAAWVKVRAVCGPISKPPPKESRNTRKEVPGDIKEHLINLLAGITMERFREEPIWAL